MWIYTPTGFISAVAKDGTSTGPLTVRARDRRSLDQLAELCGQHVQFGGGTDYPYRLVITRGQFQSWLVAQLNHLDYANFKNEAYQQRGREYAHVLGAVWTTNLALEDDEVTDSYLAQVIAEHDEDA